MKQRVIEIVSEAAPAADVYSDFLFAELDSLNVVTILMILSKEFNIELTASDATPKNFMTIDAIVKMIEDKKK